MVKRQVTLLELYSRTKSTDKANLKAKANAHTVVNVIVGKKAVKKCEKPAKRAESVISKVYRQPHQFSSPHDVLYCTEYAGRIFRFLHGLERQSAMPTAYLDNLQTDLRADMITTVADWLLEIVTGCKLSTETYFLSLNVFHRFLSRRRVARTRLQLVAAACLFLSAKYEDCFPPLVDDMVYMAKEKFTGPELLAAEREVLNTLDFRITVATPRAFMKRFSYMTRMSASDTLLASFLLEVSARLVEFAWYPPSVVAGAAVHLARMSAARVRVGWPVMLTQHAGLTLDAVLPCARALNAAWAAAATGDSIAYRKYSKDKFGRVARLSAIEGLEG